MRKIITISVSLIVAGALLVMAADEGKETTTKPAAVKQAVAKATTAKSNAAFEIKLSGPGAVDQTTIKAGKPVSIEVYVATEKPRRAFTAGFKLASPDIETVQHVMDTGKGLNEVGDIKGFNGWEDQSVWDLKGLIVANTDWDGKLPDVLGIGGISVKKGMKPQPSTKQLTFDIILPTAGTLVVDTAFYPPGGFWKFEDGDRAAWGGPYTFKVVE